MIVPMSVASEPRDTARRRRVAGWLGATCLALAAASDPAAGYDGGRLWRVSRAGVPDSYVLGTIHVADDRVSAIARPVADALAKSRSLAMEIVPGPVSGEDLDGLESLDDGARLESLIGPLAYGRVRVALLTRGLRSEAIERLKPWAAWLRIGGPPSDASDARSLDENLLLAARERRMVVWSLEAAEEQAAAFDTIPVDTQVALLLRALGHADRSYPAGESAIDAWLRADLRALARWPTAPGVGDPAMDIHYARLIKHVIHDRTTLLHHRLFMPLRKGRVFIAVGASHLHGDEGLLAMIARDGYRITRVW